MKKGRIPDINSISVGFCIKIYIADKVILNIFTGGLNTMDEKPKKKHKILKAFETASVVDIDKRMPYSRVGVPRDQAVHDAKEWVDNNEK